MKITVIAIGKIKEKYFSDAIDEYLKRCSRFAKVEVVQLAEAPPSKSAMEQRQIESAALYDRAKGYIIATDIGGKELTSEELSALIDKKSAEGASEITFLIGGSNGLSEEGKERADMRISFGRQTYPHQLFRVMLLEQIYRSLAILNGVPYHK